MNEVPLSQCPLCGEETDPDAVDSGINRRDNTKIKIFAVGILIGGLLRQIIFMIQLWIGG